MSLLCLLMAQMSFRRREIVTAENYFYLLSHHTTADPPIMAYMVT